MRPSVVRRGSAAVLAAALLLFCVRSAQAADAPPPAGPPAGPQGVMPGGMPAPQERGAIGGQPQIIGFYAQINPDCSVAGIPAVRLLVAPQHGAVLPVAAPGYTNFPPGNQRYACNLHKSPGTTLLYRAQPGFAGQDTVAVSVIYPNGMRQVDRFVITVEPAFSPGTPHDGWRSV